MATKKKKNAATKDVAKETKKLAQKITVTCTKKAETATAKKCTKKTDVVVAETCTKKTQAETCAKKTEANATESTKAIPALAKAISVSVKTASAPKKATPATVHSEPEISDEELIIDFVKGNDISFQSLVDRYKSKVYSLAMRLTKNQEDSEEVLQDVFITVYRKIDGFEGKSKFSSWLYRITVNSAFMKLRKRKQERYISIEDIIINKDNADSLSNHIVPNSSETEINNDDLRYHLETAISKLPPDYRAVYILRDIDELSNKEVSAILHIGIPAVKSRLHRSRLMLKKRLFQTYNEYKGLPIAQVMKGKKAGSNVKHAA